MLRTIEVKPVVEDLRSFGENSTIDRVGSGSKIVEIKSQIDS